MKITERPLPGLTLCLAAVLGGAGAAGAATAPLDAVAVDATGVTQPWMVEQLPDGRIELRWGAIQNELAAPSGRVLDSGGTTPAALAAARTTCSLTLAGVVRSGSFLTSSLHVSCTAGYVYISAQSYFEYRTLLSASRYSRTRNFGPTSNSADTWNQVVACRVGAGNHQYRLRARGFSPTIGWSPWYAGGASATTSCGTSEP